jgi:chromosomal replication initiation ATPase DnaA
VARQLRLELRQPTSVSREDFVVSLTNAPAVRALDAWPAWYGGCLALIGPPGSGKSHLARDWAAKTGALVLTGAEGPKAIDLSRIGHRPVLIEDADRGVDDETLFHLINRAGGDGGGLLLTARVLPQAWCARLPDLRSRLNAMHVAELPPPDDVILEGLLRTFFRERNISPAEDLIPYLLRRIERSAVSARQIVDRLDEAAVAEHRPVSRALARQFFEIEDETLDAGE